MRTDFSDDQAWRAAVHLLNRSRGSSEVHNQLVDDRAFTGASPDEVVLSTVAGDPDLEVVFLADAATMRGDHTLLAVSTRTEELNEDDDEEELSREFRLLPTLVNEMHVNLAIGNLDFWEYAYTAARDPEQTLRS